ncbi:MAG: hypothetical protein HYY16_00940 [Planctomycetes bacterium]|nr:hypothetical protein [Planctomycetota bacterium]
MNPRRIEKIRKRDGQVEPYDEAKIAESILQAARGAGREDRSLAADLAGVVTMYLERTRNGHVPTSAEIRRLVEKILIDTGHAEIARVFGGDAAPAAGELFPTELFLVDGATRDEVSAWARERITAALVKEASIEEPVAREIAGAVEQCIFRQSERRVSTTLIRELVNQELLARGYGTKLRKQLVVGLPKYDLERLIRPEDAAPDPERLCRTIGETTLKQYALQEIYPRQVAAAHLEGRIHIHDLECPQKLFWHTVRLEATAPTSRGVTAELSARVRDLRRAVRHCEIPRVNALYAGRPGDVDEAPFVVGELGPSWVGVDLGDGRLACELIRSWKESATPEFFVQDAAFHDGTALREACRLAIERGRTLFLFERGTANRSRFDAETLGGAVTLNVAQAFYRSEGGTDFYAELDQALDAAARAHAAKRPLVRKVAPADDHLYAIGMAGLDEAVRLMTGRAPAEDDGALRVALRIVSYLFFRVKEESGRHGLRMALHDVAGGEVAGRLMRVDGQMFARARGLAAEYSVGGRLWGAAGMSPLDHVAIQARFHTLLPCAAAMTSARRSLSPEDMLTLLRRVHAETSAAQLWVA